MKRIFAASAASIMIASAVTAAIAASHANPTEDAIAARKALMRSVGAASAVAGGIMKGEIAYTPAIGDATLKAFHATATVYGDYFPEGSDMGSDTTASPKIWEDPDGFAAELAKLQEATAAGVVASGRTGPADADAFKAVMGPIFGTCKSCHEGYRTSN